MEYKKLKDIAEIIMGQSPESSSYNTEGDGIPFFQGNADFGELYPSKRVWCNAPKKIAEANDILISVRAPIGALNFANERCCIGRGLAAIRIQNHAERNYIFHLLKAKHTELIEKGTGSTFKAIGKSVLEEVPVPVISEKKQQHDMIVMDTVESIIRQRKSEIRQLDTLVQARFVEMFGNENNSMNWPVVNVEDIAYVQVGVVIKPAQYYTEKRNGIRAFRSLNIGSMYIKDNDWVYFSKEGQSKNAKAQLKENDLLIVRSGAPGTACVVTKDYEGCYAIDLIIARPNTTKINPYYLCEYTNMPHGKRQIEEGTGGAAQKHFNVGKYNKMRVMLPPLEQQNTFVHFLNKIDKSKSAIQQSLDETQTLFDSLMQKYFG